MVSELTNATFKLADPAKYLRLQKIMKREREIYIQHWEKTKQGAELSPAFFEIKQYTVWLRISSRSEIKTHRHLLTKYRLNDHQLAMTE